MDVCTVETGLLRKTPCGHAAVAKCANCEQPLCSKHAIAQLSPAGAKTGTFLCAECNAAQRQFEETEPVAPAAPPKPTAPAVRPSPGAAKPAAAPAPAAEKPKPADEDSGGIDFTPSKK